MNGPYQYGVNHEPPPPGLNSCGVRRCGHRGPTPRPVKRFFTWIFTPSIIWVFLFETMACCSWHMCHCLIYIGLFFSHLFMALYFRELKCKEPSYLGIEGRGNLWAVEDYKEQSYLGTSIVRRLRLLGYQGLICIHLATFLGLSFFPACFSGHAPEKREIIINLINVVTNGNLGSYHRTSFYLSFDTHWAANSFHLSNCSHRVNDSLPVFLLKFNFII